MGEEELESRTRSGLATDPSASVDHSMHPHRDGSTDGVPDERDLSIAVRLRQARERHGLTQKGVVEALNWRWRKKLSRFETGESKPNLDDAAALAEFYGVSLDWLAGRSPHPSGLAPGHIVADRKIASIGLDATGLGAGIDPRAVKPRPFTVPDDPVVLPPETGNTLMRRLGADRD